MILKSDISALLLCGGQARRFARIDKPLAVFQGPRGPLPMVDYMLASLPAELPVMISANRNLAQYAQRGRVLTDADTQLKEDGPLIGIYAGLMACETPWLLVCPGDMPLLPHGWYEDLLHVEAPSERPRVLHDGQRLQSLLCLLPKTLAEHLGRFIRGGGNSVKAWHSHNQALQVSFAGHRVGFANINSQAEMTALQQTAPYSPICDCT
ncbi:MAG: NTP transferase domain-containing protein [Proteobacteria bacterium]|nr:NTP transferase domain-containing protein [Pseudomonadota bacterium]